MRWIFFALLLLAAAVGLTLFAQQDPGYVLLRYGGWSLESSLTVLLLALLVLFALMGLGLRLLWGAWCLPAAWLAWRQRRRRERARRYTNEGLLALAEGHWARAERRLLRGASRGDSPLLNYLCAARAAQQQGEVARRDRYLALAYRQIPAARLAVGLTQAELQLEQGQLELALASLRQLQQAAPRHTHVLLLLQQVYRRLQSWSDLRALLPQLRQQRVMPETDLQALEQETYQQCLQGAQRVDRLQQVWDAMSKTLQQQPELLQVYVQRLVDLGAWQEAEERLAHFLKKQYHLGLARLYGQLPHGEAHQRLAFLERWLKEHASDAELLLAVGRLALRERLWGKARSYLEASLGQQDRPETRHQLADLLIQLGESEQALALFHPPA